MNQTTFKRPSVQLNCLYVFSAFVICFLTLSNYGVEIAKKHFSEEAVAKIDCTWLHVSFDLFILPTNSLFAKIIHLTSNLTVK